MSDSAALSSRDNNVSSAASSAAAPLLGQSDAVRVQIVPESSESESKLLETPMDSGDEDLAIRLEGAYKHYGSGRNKSPVLIGLDMSVPRGKIYGLLGPSGCGKTTLLKCIVGKLGVDGGIVHVFGEPPGGGNNGVPGAQVGYMPQELALFGEFNIEETLTYFRRIYGMSFKKYEERLDFLMKFLDLPSRTRKLINMSGGQQRRASLAVALLHEPALLILDEPTVGVDPLLRTSMWDHFLSMTNNNNSDKSSTTIVITTHYIEEARQAHRVGMMRFGKLLAEDSPDNLIKRCYERRLSALLPCQRQDSDGNDTLRVQKPNLEDVFLELCMQDGDMETARVRVTRTERPDIIKRKKSSEKKKKSETNGDVVVFNGDLAHSAKSDLTHNSHPLSTTKTPKRTLRDRFRRDPDSSRKTAACMLKTFNRMKKRVGFLLYQFVLPAIQVSLFCLAIGQDPKEQPVAVVNAENFGAPCPDAVITQCPISLGSLGIPEPNDYLANFTCRYLSFIDREIARPVYYPNVESAIQAVEDGEAWGVLAMDQNFTQDLYKRIFDSLTESDLQAIDTELMEKSSIKVRMDITNQHIALTLQLKFAEAFQNFLEQMVTSCDLPKEIASIPLVFQEPIYGTKELTFTDFMAPGIILTIVHSMALGYSAMIIIMERNEGLLDRTWVAGVTPGEFALAHFLVSLVVNLLQVIVTLVFMILVFQVPNEGSIWWVFLLTMLQGICGTTIGLIISAVCETQQDATQVALGIFYPNLILSGIIWPVESMPVALRYFAYMLPQTFACEAMRAILLRGWGITYMPVWRGFVVTIAWIVGTYIIFNQLVNRQEEGTKGKPSWMTKQYRKITSCCR